MHPLNQFQFSLIIYILIKGSALQKEGCIGNDYMDYLSKELIR